MSVRIGDPPSPLELWAGFECTVVRVGDAYHDQLERSGHASRPEDLELVADLGIRALRYPVLWERTAPEGLDGADWSAALDRLGRIRRLGVRPIVGLVHHGSGPRHTGLVEPSFADGLATFARAVAERFPWVEDYTPVNEPLTTARFSGLYGHWYPHGRDGRTFARALVNQCRAVVLAMAAVRAVNPAARLVQTDDLGRTYSTRPLQYQADFENERRWLTFDLLCGRVDRRHPMWDELRQMGIADREIGWFLDHPCPPDVVGINHYLTSERFLDHRVDLYPPEVRGGNGGQAYADVEAVRVRAAGTAGPGVLLGEAWRRYGLPLAVTEVHLGCTREEQLRWFREVWDAALDLRRAGADVRAVTAWAVMGSFDWDSLMTRPTGRYEPGAFDLNAPRPRPTALAGLLRCLADGREPDHPVLDGPGWWHRPGRLLYPPVGGPARATPATPRPRADPDRPRVLAITGATGTLGRAFARLCELRGLPHRLLSRRELDIADPAAVAATLEELRPWGVLNAAGYTRIDDAQREPEACRRANADGPAVLAAGCAGRGLAFLTFSSDLVFGGDRDHPYVEGDAIAPLNVYGRIQAEAEARVSGALPTALIVRTGAVFGPWDARNFVTTALRTLAAGRPFAAADDAIISPTYVPDLVHAALDLMIDGERGVWHLANRGATTWADLARSAAELAGLDPSAVEGRPSSALGHAAPRPRYSALGSDRGMILPDWEDALRRYFGQCEARWAFGPADRPASSPREADVFPDPVTGEISIGCPEPGLAAPVRLG